MQTESLNQLWAEWILKWLISDFSLLSSSTHSFILKCLGQRNKERQLLYSHNSSNAVRLITLAGFKKQNKQTKTLKKKKIKKITTLSVISLLFSILVCLTSSLVTHLKPCVCLFFVNLSLTTDSATAGQLSPKSDQQTPWHHSQRRLVFHFKKRKGEEENNNLKRKNKERNSSKRQLRPRSTREELQAEHAAQIT